MSFVFDDVKFSVKSSNNPSPARISSTLDETYLLIVANNCNNYYVNDYNNAGIVGAHSSNDENGTKYETYIGLRSNNVINKIARFNSENINLDTNTIVRGNVIPSSTIEYDIGSVENRWRDLYLSGSSVFLNNTTISSDSNNNSLIIEDQTNTRVPMVAGEFKIQTTTSDNMLVLSEKDNNLSIVSLDSNNNVVKELDLSVIPTSALVEDTNLFYTAERVAAIASASNIETSNYIRNSSNAISNKLTTTDNHMSNYLLTTSNIISTRITNVVDETAANLLATSNEISHHMNTDDFNMSNYLLESSNTISTRISNTDSYTSNYILITSNTIRVALDDLDTLVRNDVQTKLEQTSNFAISMDNDMSNYLLESSNTISTRITNLSADEIADGDSNKFIINGAYTGDVNIIGTLTADNLNIVGDTTTINTVTYQTENLEIVTTAPDGAAFRISQTGTGEHNLFEASFEGNTKMVIESSGQVGIGKTPISNYTLDVNGIINTDFIKGEGSGITNVNLADKTTTELAEGDNLYYTAARVGVITFASNVETSNYIRNTSNTISTRITNVVEETAANLLATSNIISDHINTNDMNMSNHVLETSNIISYRIDTLNLDIVAQGEVNKFVINDVYHGNLFVTGKVVVTALEIADLEYILEQEGTCNIGNFYQYIDAVSSNVIKIRLENTSNDIMSNVLSLNTSPWTIADTFIEYSSGTVGIGTQSPNASDKLHVEGDTYVNGTLRASGDILSSFSDMRLKTKIGDIDNSIDKIMNISTFKYVASDIAKSMNITDTSIQVGVSAQDVQAVLPEIVKLAPFDSSNIGNGEYVSCSGNNYLTVAYERLVPLLIEGIKELKKEIDEMKKNV